MSVCGIVGIAAVGLKQPGLVERLLEGLKRLEYRGYDSAGIAVVKDGKLICRKTVGKIEALQAALTADPIENVFLGMGHTRWATHGAVTVANAHPQTDGTIAVVHNGIIENAEILKQDLLKTLNEDLKAAKSRNAPDAVQIWVQTFRGQPGDPTLLPIQSQTDTEILVHLVARERRWGVPFQEAVSKTLQKVSGTYATVFLDKTSPGQMIAARKGSPLTIGRGADGQSFFLASDIAVLASWAKEFADLGEGEGVFFQRVFNETTENGFTTHFFTIAPCREKKTPSWKPLQSDVLSVDKGSFPNFTRKEISEQPLLLQSMIDRFEKGTFASFAQKLASRKSLNLVACGSSFYASLIGRYWAEAFTGIATQAEIASEFRYRNPVVTPQSMNLFLSQSGETIDTLKALELVQTLPFSEQAQGPACGVITNVPHSLMAKTVTNPSLPAVPGPVLLLEAGAELSVVSTKAFTAQLAMLAALVLEVVRIRSREEPLSLIGDFKRIPAQVHAVLSDAESNSFYDIAALLLADAHTVLYLGRGVSYPIALEGALKLKETAYIPTEGYPAGELKHGPIALVDNRTVCVILAPGDDLFTKTLSNAQEIMARGGHLLFITDERGASQLQALNVTELSKMLVVPNGGPISTAFTLSVACQMLAYRTARRKGYDVDRPRNLAKAVTVE